MKLQVLGACRVDLSELRKFELIFVIRETECNITAFLSFERDSLPDCLTVLIRTPFDYVSFKLCNIWILERLLGVAKVFHKRKCYIETVIYSKGLTNFDLTGLCQRPQLV